MAEYKINLTLTLDAESPKQAEQYLQQILSGHPWEMVKIELRQDKPAQFSSAVVRSDKNRPVSSAEPYVTYRVADEKFRIFAKELGLQGTELRVPKNRDFLQFRVRGFLEQLGYQVEPKVNLRVVSESHTEPLLAEDNELIGSSEECKLVLQQRN